jgi:hypothetical protein
VGYYCFTHIRDWRLTDRLNLLRNCLLCRQSSRSWTGEAIICSHSLTSWTIAVPETWWLLWKIKVFWGILKYFKGISRFLNLPTFLLYGFASGDLRASQLTPACQLRAFAVQWETYFGISASEIHHFHSCQIVLNVVLSCIILYHIMYSVVYSICVWYLLIVYYYIVLYEIIVCHQIAFQYCIAQCYLNSVQLYHVSLYDMFLHYNTLYMYYVQFFLYYLILHECVYVYYYWYCTV